MHNIQAKRILTNPKAMMDYQLTGRLPPVRLATKSPLWVLLNSLTPMERERLKAISLNPKLGYSCSLSFSSGNTLFDWLGGNKVQGEWQSLPCDSYIIRSFRNVLLKHNLLDSINRRQYNDHQ